MIEQTSRLLWKCNYEMQNEIVNPGNFAVIDSGSFETFMTAIYDCSVPLSKQILKPKNVIRLSGDWNSIEKPNNVLLKARLGKNLSATVDKYKERLRIQFFDMEEQALNLEASRRFED